MSTRRRYCTSDLAHSSSVKVAMTGVLNACALVYVCDDEGRLWLVDREWVERHKITGQVLGKPR